jgi:predicted ABC-type ATPase
VPVLHLLAGPNGSGKSTYVALILQPVAHLQFVNADERTRMLANRRSFITETVFSHPSKLELVSDALARGYLVHLHVLLLPVDVAVRRVAERVQHGGHDVPEQKIRERYDRLWSLIARARLAADSTEFLDNSTAATPFRRVALYERGLMTGASAWPSWVPEKLTES